MIGMFIFVGALGWIAGVHMPWQGMAFAYVVASCWAWKGITEGLAGILEVMLVLTFLAVMTAVGFVTSDVTIVDALHWVSYLFTGSKG